MKAFFLVLAFGVAAVVGHPLEVDRNACPGPICPQGCCPMPGYVCCADNLYCAETAEDCPDVLRAKLASKDSRFSSENLRKKSSNSLANSGKVLEDVPVKTTNAKTHRSTERHRRKLMTSKNSRISPEDCPGSACSRGCCPEPGWVCCPDNLYCASAVQFCPKKSKFFDKFSRQRSN
jgi:hypothetical protein